MGGHVIKFSYSVHGQLAELLVEDAAYECRRVRRLEQPEEEAFDPVRPRRSPRVVSRDAMALDRAINYRERVPVSVNPEVLVCFSADGQE